MGVNLFGNPEGVAERERKLLGAVLQAQQVARYLCNARPNDNQIKLLFGQLEAVRLELEQIRKSDGAVPFDEIDPKWTGLLPWRMIPEC
jgi:hypothetical protein